MANRVTSSCETTSTIHIITPTTWGDKERNGWPYVKTPLQYTWKLMELYTEALIDCHRNLHSLPRTLGQNLKYTLTIVPLRNFCSEITCHNLIWDEWQCTNEYCNCISQLQHSNHTGRIQSLRHKATSSIIAFVEVILLKTESLARNISSIHRNNATNACYHIASDCNSYLRIFNKFL